ncbi:MAG: Ni/Fe hydrogenase subunit alpha [Candidatus Kerfeldbacteria bacterium]|jgi:coenzyme F420-reducing hydrogenase alpha subunit
MKVKIKHITKIEGHATFWGALKKGDIAEAKYHTLEGARLIEGVLIGRNYNDAPLITSRICGVCPVVHNLTSIQGIERAMKVKVSDSTILLRKMMMYGQFIQSHSLHAYFMTIPDFYGKDSALDLLKEAPKQSGMALKIRGFGNLLTEVIGGRTVHPVNSQIGGFLKLPPKRRMQELMDSSQEILQEAVELAHFISHLKFIDFHRKTEYVSLYNKKEYAIYDGDVRSTDGLVISPQKFHDEVDEIQQSWDLIKRTKFKGRIYWAGALSRINNNWQQLNPIAKQAFKHNKFKIPIDNSFYNVLAQAIEIIHCMEETQKLLKKYLALKNIKPIVKYKVRAGKGVGCIEAPRGILFHYYETDKYGCLKNVNIITPTAQFMNNLEADLAQYIGQNKKFGNKEYRQLAMMIRAYDPCMTCATH